MREKTYIIAEAGVNHNQSAARAKEMIAAAAECGADAIKFQTFKAESLVCRDAPKAGYQTRTTDESESQYEMIKALELDSSVHKELIACCRENRIDFLSSPFDLDSVDLLVDLGLEIIKIPSGEIINYPYLKKIGGLGLKVILSTGMADLGEIEFALDALVEAGAALTDITVLHCNTEYPTPFEDVNLTAMNTIAAAFGVKVGYSDHTEGIEVPIAAVAMGAEVIEKHFTLDKTLPGPDHKASLEPDELSLMVRSIRNIENSMGNGVKKPSPSELKNRPVIRKSIVASRPIKTGEAFSAENLTAKRPGTGISPMYWNMVVGRLAGRDYEKDEAISL